MSVKMHQQNTIQLLLLESGKCQFINATNVNLLMLPMSINSCYQSQLLNVTNVNYIMLPNSMLQLYLLNIS